MKIHSVLVVDDEPVFAGAAKKVLSRGGYEVLTANALSPAMALLSSRLLDAVITDLSLDGTRGLEGLEIAKVAKVQNPNVKVIMVTAFGSDEVSRKAMECGVDLLLDKPVSVGLLIQVLTDFGLGGTGTGRKPPAAAEPVRW